MKALRRWSTTIGLTVGVASTALFGGIFPALALPQAQVVEKLRPIPIFFIMLGENQLLSVAMDNRSEKVAPRFVSQQDAETFLAQLQQRNPQLASQARIAALPLGELYRLDQENSARQQNFEFQYLATERQMLAARALNGQFVGVPLFYATVGNETLTVQQNGQTVIPFFFEQETLMGLVEQFRRQQPAQAGSVAVKVVALESLIETLQNGNDSYLSNVYLWRSQESEAFVQSIQQQVQQQQQPNRR